MVTALLLPGAYPIVPGVLADSHEWRRGQAGRAPQR